MALIDLNIHISPHKEQNRLNYTIVLLSALYAVERTSLMPAIVQSQAELIFPLQSTGKQTLHRLRLVLMCCHLTSPEVLEIRNKEVWCVTTCVSKDYTNFSEPFFHAGFPPKNRKEKKGLLSYVAWNNLLQLFFSFAVSAKLSWYGAHPLPLSSICLSPLSAFV